MEPGTAHLAPSRVLSDTFRFEAVRAIGSGVIESASATFLVLIAVRWFEAGWFAKGWVAAGSGVGYLLTPVVVSSVARLGLPAAAAAGRLLALGAVAMLAAVLVPTLPVFVVSSVVAIATAGAIIPLLTQVYQENYPGAARGRLFARTMALRVASATAFSLGAGYLLTWDLAHVRTILFVFAAALAGSAWCLGRVPSRPLPPSGQTRTLAELVHVRGDRMFNVTLLAWMLMGFGNLMMLPLRVEYLANPRYALAMPAETIALLTGVVPNLARMVMTPIWGRLFDRVNFFVLRMGLNAGFAVGIASFFTSDSMPGLVLSAVTYGISVAGGDVAWSLWVTKVAPADRVADYMSVHTFLTGTRALIAPMVGFMLVDRWSMSTLGWISFGLILLSVAVLLPEVRHGGLARQHTSPVTPPLPIDEGEP